MSKKEAIDFGTPERQSKATIVPCLYSRSYDYHARVMDGTEIDRMLMRGGITPNEHNTLERFSEELRRAGYLSIRSIDLSDPIQSSDPSHLADRKAGKLVRVVMLIRAIDQAVSRKERDALIDLCLMDREVKIPSLFKAVRAIDNFFIQEST